MIYFMSVTTFLTILLLGSLTASPIQEVELTEEILIEEVLKEINLELSELESLRIQNALLLAENLNAQVLIVVQQRDNAINKANNLIAILFTSREITEETHTFDLATLTLTANQ
jgi:replicative superfamily II helicase